MFTAAGDGTTKSLGCQLWLKKAWRILSFLKLRTPTANLRLCSGDDSLRRNVVTLWFAMLRKIQETVAFNELLGKLLRTRPTEVHPAR